MASSPVTAPSPPSSPPANASPPSPSNSSPPPSSPPPSSPPTSSPPPSSPPPSSPPPSSPPPSSPPPSSPPPSSPPPSSSSPPPQSSSPPPSSGSTSPPPPPSPSSTSPPPSPSSTSPPPPQQGSSTPPPSSNGSSSSSSSPPPPSSNNNNNNNKNNSNTPSFSPPPPLSSSSSSRTLSPPPPAHKSSNSSSNTSNDSSSQSSSASNRIALVVGVTAGVAALLIIMIVIFVVCTKKKKRRAHGKMQYYGDPGHGEKQSNEYYNSGQYPSWQNGMQSMPPPPPGAVLPPPPGGGRGWGAPPPPGMMSSGDMSSNFSGQHHPPLPPPSPGLSLGLNNSSFSYDELAAATNGFSQANLLGQGGFGYVHKGVLANGTVVAVKSLKSGSGQGEREFQAEVEIISRVHHRHLVSLVGYCIAGGQRMLVYEFVPNKTLEYHLYGQDRPVMEWASRLRIALGAAKGLAYLHEDCHPRIIHRDIKAANILLDDNYEAMVADFGLAKLSSDNYTHVSTRVMGTFGYMAPEYASSGKLTDKSDVFSYGVMLLELITGRRPVDTANSYMEDSLVDWARPILTRALGDGNYEELIDPRLEDNYEPQEMARMVACAAASIRHSARRRPKMRQIARALEGDASLDDLNDGTRPGQSSAFSSSNGSSDYDTMAYNADMKKFRKMALESQEMGSSEYGATSEYGLNPSSTSSESAEMGRRHRN